MPTSETIDAVQRVLSPPLEQRGFLSASLGWGSTRDATILYCTDSATTATRWPLLVELLRRWIELELEQPGRCLDLVIDVSPTGQVVSATFESVDLDVLVRAAGHDDLAARCARSQLRHLGPDEVAARLGEAVEVLMPA